MMEIWSRTKNANFKAQEPRQEERTDKTLMTRRLPP